METESKIVELGNGTIAKFVGYKYKPNDSINGVKGVYHLKGFRSMRISDFKYHSSWDALMPVVEKIELIDNSENCEVDIFGRCCDIGGKIESVAKTKIEATWKAVVRFIDWYNTQNK